MTTADGRFELWFFRDLLNENRKKLFALHGIPADAIHTLGEQKLALDRLLPSMMSATAKPTEWRCFHCEEVFTDRTAAQNHFGFDECSDPACKIKAGAEGSLVAALRKSEKDCADAWAAIHDESLEAQKALQAAYARHGDQIRAAEEAGYEQGLIDGRNSTMEGDM